MFGYVRVSRSDGRSKVSSLVVRSMVVAQLSVFGSIVLVLIVLVLLLTPSYPWKWVLRLIATVRRVALTSSRSEIFNS
ncbi:hypothetical protein M0802_007620 [Mischocyttarus mexicanus]|nr:hypothetical protein M0802_007620 [Mischocyttarus mexicanus]